jgi:hypothetical protein
MPLPGPTAASSVRYVGGQTSCIHSPSARRRTSWPGVITAPHRLQAFAGACASFSPRVELTSPS